MHQLWSLECSQRNTQSRECRESDREKYWSDWNNSQVCGQAEEMLTRSDARKNERELVEVDNVECDVTSWHVWRD